MFEPTGDPEIDALFAAKAPSAEPIISDEPIKPEGALQNSGIKEADDNKSVLVPVMSQEELESNEPSFGKAMVAVKAPEGVTRANFLRLLSNAYALYLTDGRYDTDSLVARTGLAPGIVSRTISSPEFKYALSVRGITPEATGLTREQDLVLLKLTDPADNMTLSQKLRACGVSYTKYRAWMKQPIFSRQMQALTESTLADNSAALVQLDKLAGQGDLAAIKFKLEMSGRYDPNRQQNIDVVAMMSMILEIIAKNAKGHPEIVQAVAKDMGELAGQLKLTNQIGA